MKNNSSRIPEQYINRDWNYLNTIVARGGREKDFLKCVEGIDIEKGLRKIGIGQMTSIHPILIKERPLTIDFYCGRNSRPESATFKQQYGAIITALYQTRFLPQLMEIKEEKEITLAKRKRNALDAKLDF